MNKKRIIPLLLILVIIIVITWKVVIITKNKNYYQNLKNNLQEDIERVLYTISPHCEVGNVVGELLLEQEQNDYYGIDKKKLLDIDGKSYCKVKVRAKCIEDGKLSWNTYIKCKDYEDPEYNAEYNEELSTK